MTDKDKQLADAKATLESVDAAHASLLHSMERAERAATLAFAQGSVTGECIADRARVLYLDALLMAQDCERVKAKLADQIASLEAQQ